MCVNFSQFLLKNDPARPGPARPVGRENKEEKAKFSTAIGEKNRFWEFYAKNRRFLSQKHQKNRSILCPADLLLKFTLKLYDSNRKNVKKWVRLKSVKLWKVLSYHIWNFLDRLSVLNQNGVSESSVLRGAWVSKRCHFGVASAYFWDRPLLSVIKCFFWRSKSQILVVIKNVNTLSVLNQNGASESSVLREVWVSSGLFGVALAFFEIDLCLPWLNVFLTLKIADSARDKKIRRILCPKSKWSLIIDSFEAGLGIKKVPLWCGVGVFLR